MLGENDDLVMVDLEQQYWPYLWHPAWPPLAIWVHVILTLKKADTDSSSKTNAALSLLACKDHCCSYLLSCFCYFPAGHFCIHTHTSKLTCVTDLA